MDQKISESTLQRAKSDIVGTISKYVELKKNGSEYIACCPFHKERTPSFSVIPDKDFFYCHGCGAGGDAIDFVVDFEQINFREAVSRIVGDLLDATAVPAQRQTVKAEEKPEWVPIVPVPADVKVKPKDIFNSKRDGEWQKLTASKRWDYLDANGALIGCISRFEKPGGGKEVIPQSFCVNTVTGEMSWRWLSFAKPRPLYGLNKIANHQNAQVMLVEGEKACDAGQQKFIDAGISLDQVIVVSWPGGGKAVPFVDWSPLTNRGVGLWPDADQQVYVDTHPKAGQLVPFLEQPGTVAMLDIFDRIKADAASVKFVVPPTGVECGWDLADDFPEGMSLLPFVKSAAMLAADVRERFAVVEETPAADVMPWEGEPEPDYSDVDTSGGAPEPDPAPARAQRKPDATVDDDEDDDLAKNVHFTILGYDGGDYYLFSHAKKQVMRMRKGDITDIGLIEYAPLNWWEFHFPAGGKQGGINRPMAAQWVFATAHARGIYDPTRVRGRGVWRDKDRFVFHHGAYLSVDGVATDIAKIESSYVYPMARRMPEPADTALTDEEGEHMVAVADQVRWTMPASGALMSGWVMLAPICGALDWRPHIWLTGGAGSGKSQPHSAKVLTPNGWSTMGQMAVGSYVSTPDNGFGKVVGIYPQGFQKVYKLTFADGRTTRATADHLWKVREKHAWRLRTTADMIEVLSRGTRSTTMLAVPLAEAMTVRDCNGLMLPLHPYALGVMLGDGSFADKAGGGNLTVFDPEIVERARKALEGSMFNFYDTNTDGRYRLGDLSRYGKKTRETIKELRLLGTKSETKFIPRAYLDASIEDRIELLKGLMDTDGHAGKAGCTSYCTVSEQLRDDVVELVRSLGGIASVSVKQPTYEYLGSTLNGKTAYNINIRIKDRTMLFSLPRKLERVATYQYDDCLYLNVRSIVEDGEEECSCIMIDHPDRLYVTDNFVVTHNTTIQRDYCQSAVNGLSVYAQGNSTEPGIRQKLRADALPVLLDEAESNNEREKQRIESILSLIRQSSSESQAETLKGTVSGDSMNFHIRSMFCLSSINTLLDKKADTDRLTRLSIKSPAADGKDEAHWELLKEELHKMSTDLTLPSRLLARAINMLPVIIESIGVFTKAAAKHFGSQREGDQFGTLLAGCWCLQKGHVPSIPEALVLIKGYDWTEHTEDNDQDDSQRALESILNAKIRLGGSVGDLTVYELVREAHSLERQGTFDMKEADRALKRHGIRLEEKKGVLLFGTSVPNLKSLLANSAYSSDVRGQLLRLPGATKNDDLAVRFNGSGSKCVAVPLNLVLDGKTESQSEIPI